MPKIGQRFLRNLPGFDESHRMGVGVNLSELVIIESHVQQSSA
jgi:hypothetical protein